MIEVQLHFEARIARQERHEDGDLEDGIILPVSRVVSFQEAAPRRRSRSGKLGQIQVGESQFLI